MLLDRVSFFVLIYSVMFTINPNNLKNKILEFLLSKLINFTNTFRFND